VKHRATYQRLTFEAYEDARDEWRWRLVSSRGRIVADSGEGYATRASCLRAIALVRGSALRASGPVRPAGRRPWAVS